MPFAHRGVAGLMDTERWHLLVHATPGRQAVEEIDDREGGRRLAGVRGGEVDVDLAAVGQAVQDVEAVLHLANQRFIAVSGWRAAR